MKLSGRNCNSCGYWIWAGLGLMSMALFIHPMSPENFLGLAWSDPLQTLKDAYGIQATMMFWISVTLVGVGLAAGMACLVTSKRPAIASRAWDRRKKTAPYTQGPQLENIEEYWSYL